LEPLHRELFVGADKIEHEQVVLEASAGQSIQTPDSTDYHPPIFNPVNGSQNDTLRQLVVTGNIKIGSHSANDYVLPDERK
jgi:hypothetical protein